MASAMRRGLPVGWRWAAVEEVGVLDDHERMRLRDIERHLLVEDPRFLRSFDTRARQLGRERPDRVLVKIVIAAAALLSGLMLVTGSVDATLVFAAVGALVWMVWKG